MLGLVLTRLIRRRLFYLEPLGTTNLVKSLGCFFNAEHRMIKVARLELIASRSLHA
jgi:hypothetical protein